MAAPCVLVLFVPNPYDQERAAKRQALLGELAEIGMALARDLPRQAAAPDADLDAVALKYARISRAVRRTLALEARFEQDTLEWTTRAAKRRGARRKLDVEQLVTRAIESEFSEEVAEHLVDKLDERLLEDLDEDYAEAPLPMLAAQICQALGVPFDPALWEEEFSPTPSSSSFPGSSRGSGNAGAGDLPQSSAPMDGRDKPGDDEQKLESEPELAGDWSPPRPSG